MASALDRACRTTLRDQFGDEQDSGLLQVRQLPRREGVAGRLPRQPRRPPGRGQGQRHLPGQLVASIPVVRLTLRVTSGSERKLQRMLMLSRMFSGRWLSFH